MIFRSMEQFEKRYFPKGRDGKGWMKWIERTPEEQAIEKYIDASLKRQGRRGR